MGDVLSLNSTTKAAKSVRMYIYIYKVSRAIKALILNTASPALHAIFYERVL